MDEIIGFLLVWEEEKKFVCHLEYIARDRFNCQCLVDIFHFRSTEEVTKFSKIYFGLLVNF